MNDKLMTDVGENYEYIRTIIDNRIELFKIDVAENTGKILGYVAIGLILLIFALLILIGLTVSLAVFLANLLGSTALGILLTSLVLAIIAILIFKFRRKLFFEPIAYGIFKRRESTKEEI